MPILLSFPSQLYPTKLLDRGYFFYELVDPIFGLAIEANFEMAVFSLVYHNS